MTPKATSQALKILTFSDIQLLIYPREMQKAAALTEVCVLPTLHEIYIEANATVFRGGSFGEGYIRSIKFMKVDLLNGLLPL